MHPIKPFVAYLEGLRGRPKLSTGPLDVERIKLFGLPYALPGDGPPRASKPGQGDSWTTSEPR